MRKNIRDTPIWKRAGALSCLERANSITNYRVESFLIIAGTALSHSFGMSLILAGMAVLVDVIRARTDDGLVQRPPLLLPRMLHLMPFLVLCLGSYWDSDTAIFVIFMRPSTSALQDMATVSSAPTDVDAVVNQEPNAATQTAIDDSASVKQQPRPRTGLIVGDDGKRHTRRFINGGTPFHQE
jgi:hypothetical protein